jgi:uncharacterized protein (DUF1499 family)
MKTSLKNLVLVLVSVGLSGCASAQVKLQDRQVGNGLSPCPAKPNCVVSEYSGEHYIAPISVGSDVANMWRRVGLALAKMDRTQIVEQQSDYIRAEVKTLSGLFIDDFELRLDAAKQELHLRSASRLGYYDFGVNRRRVERFRELLTAVE